MAIRGIEQDLGCDVVRCSTDGPRGISQAQPQAIRDVESLRDDLLFALSWKLDQCSQAKVSNSEIHVVVEHQVCQFQVTMDD